MAIIVLTGCAGNYQEYQKAFDREHSLTQNQYSFNHSPDAVFKIVKQTFIQQGFTIENADLNSGIIKAVRTMQDTENKEISYTIHASADISAVAEETNVSLAASEQTTLHRATTTWWHLFWIIPLIPTGTEYQTLVIKEGDVTDPSFYTDFFNSTKVSVTKYEMAEKAAAVKAAEKAKAERLAAEKAEAERLAAEKAAAEKAEAERLAAEKAAAEKAEAERLAAEKAAAEKAEAERLAAEKAAAEKAEAERLAAEKAAAEKAEAEAKAASKNADAKKKAAKKKVAAKKKPAEKKEAAPAEVAPATK
jgi:hypothetical protein